MARLIGEGMFTKCYLLDNNTVQLESVDNVKECMALWGFPESYLFPTIEAGDVLDTGERLYKMRYYPKTASLKNTLEPRQWRLYQALRGLSVGYVKKDYDLAMHWCKAFESLPDEFEEEKEALIGALDSLSNYGQDICFEISPRNVRAMDGKLLLLDCFFFRSALIKSKRG